MKKKKVEFPLAYEVRIQYVRPVLDSMYRIRCSAESHELIMKYIGDLSLDYKEYVWILTLSRSNRVLGISLISTGSVFGTIVSISEIAQLSLLRNASAVVLIHNHPSGNLVFSEPDKRLTQQIRMALKLFEILLLDHLVITTEGYVSMADEGLM
ncbi:MAG: DNA repair protein RadC [Crocinitomicaceae bacterium]|jgi:DNA repair protein RadC